ncbi:26S proteasome non-ATPase regulatory subunit 10 [Culex quinquefasciatus]|uniref:26S proteasome non-ATPase regulatory subunit 10 n=1 Tax=Culex quinquefasciatus TaxID=7176 RepID=B0XCH4_CULQU|nr:26S proteasome non-ATPase regulatory subunit 10 [Culex quinquefasciatus]|eukprot:XP_001867346.1 26S proteasome non-ATPase regulatory subunit 10 [Culex quinquefasciatus]
MVLFQLLHNDQVESFYLGSNLDGIGALDDIVLKTHVVKNTIKDADLKTKIDMIDERFTTESLLPSGYSIILEDFFNKLRLYTKQATEDELKDVVVSMIKLKDYEYEDALFFKTHEAVQKWWASSGQRDLLEYRQNQLVPRKIDTVDDKVVIVTAGPGIGKSMMLTGRAAAIKTNGGHEPVVDYLLGKSAIVDTETAENGQTALHLAAAKGHSIIIEALLGKKANINARTTDSGATPLHLAAQQGSTEVVSKLLENGADKYATTLVDGETPLHVGCRYGHLDIVKLLTANEEDINIRTTKNESTPLHVATENRQAAIAKFLLEIGALVNVVTKDLGFTPLHFAAQNDLSETVSLLLDKDAPTDSISNTKPYITCLKLLYHVHSLGCEVKIVLLDKAEVEQTLSVLSKVDKPRCLFIAVLPEPDKVAIEKLRKKITVYFKRPVKQERTQHTIERMVSYLELAGYMSEKEF